MCRDISKGVAIAMKYTAAVRDKPLKEIEEIIVDLDVPVIPGVQFEAEDITVMLTRIIYIMHLKNQINYHEEETHFIPMKIRMSFSSKTYHSLLVYFRGDLSVQRYSIDEYVYKAASDAYAMAVRCLIGEFVVNKPSLYGISGNDITKQEITLDSIQQMEDYITEMSQRESAD
jgi:hypothetical protein